MGSDIEKLQSQVTMFGNRLAKRAAYFRKWAKRQQLSCYRIYDRDIPEIPLSVDFYGFVDPSGNVTRQYAYIALFERPYEKDPREEDIWLDAMCAEAARVLDLVPDHVIFRRRKRQKGSDQYEKMDAHRHIEGVVQEGALRFEVNLSDYLDTGLFMDHRPLRDILMKSAKQCRVLNLFGYTGALSVSAAAGGASFVHTVDLSNTYLKWARRNLELNNLCDDNKIRMTRSDVIYFLQQESKRNDYTRGKAYDIILLDPPTFSNSSMTDNVLDTNRQWPDLVVMALECLNPGGLLYFSTNSKRLSFNENMLPASVHRHVIQIEDITSISLPEDFKSHRIHRCWRMKLGE